MAETGLAPIYRYYTADLLTNEILAEIPFRGVSYERAIKGAGGFSGSIPVIEATKSMDIYESTMPGNTALYVVRNGVCVWGGIIWTRAYDVVGRVLNVTASEFTSYFYHRRFWKTWGHSYGATLTVLDGVISARLDNGSASSALNGGASIKLQFDDPNHLRYDGFYKISSSPAPTYTTFNIDNAQTIATVNVVSRTSNIVTAITDSAHGLSVNDTVQIDFGTGAGAEFSGTHVVLSVGGSEGTVLTFHLEGSDVSETDVSGTLTRPIPDGTYNLVTVSVRADTYDFIRSMIDSVFADFVGIDFPNTYIEPGISYNYEIIQKEVVDGVATLKTAEPHDLAEGQAVQIQNVDPMFDGEFYVTETRAADEFSYELGGYLPTTPVAVNTQDIQKISATDGIVMVTTRVPHGFLKGQSVIIETGTTEGGIGPMLNGTFTISEVTSTTVFKYSSGYPTTFPEIVYDPATASSEVRRNLVYNPSFSASASGWAGTGSTPASISRSTSEFYVGNSSLQVACDGSVASQGVYMPTKISVSGSTSYAYSAYIKGEVDKVVQLEFSESDLSSFTTEIGTAANNTVGAIALQSDGKIILAGDFTTWGGTTTGRIVRLGSDGSKDSLFAANIGTAADASIYCLAVQTDGKIIVGGNFTSWDGTTVGRIVRLNSDGTRDTAFSTNIGTGAASPVGSLSIQTNGQILVGGTFTTWGGTTVSGLVRLNSDGTRDTAFSTNVGTGTGNSSETAIQSDGKIVVGGSFATWNGATVNNIVRLNSDGTRDTAFTTNTGTGANSSIGTVAIQSDGKIVLGGTFTTWNGATVGRIVRLNSDGTHDTTFTTNTGTGSAGSVITSALQSDGKIVLGGSFTTWNGTTVGRIVRLNSDGTRDTSFTTANGTGATGGNIMQVAIQSDSKILAGGWYTAWNGVAKNYIVRLSPSGAIEAAGGSPTTTVSSPVTMTGGWQRLNIVKSTLSSTTVVQISVKNVNASAHTFYVDAVMFEAGSVPTEYFDGDTVDTYSHTYSWSATANNSESIEIHNIDIILAEIFSNTVTLTSTEPPDFFSGQSVTVSGVYPQISISEKSFDAASSKATVTTASNHNLQVGDSVNITGLRDYSSISARTVSGTTVTMQTNLSHNIFIGDVVTISDMKDVYSLTKKKIDGNVATLTCSAAHNISAGNTVSVYNIYDTYPVTNKILNNNVATLTLDVSGSGHNFAVNDEISIAGITDTSTVISKTIENGIATLTTDFPHNFLENDDVTISGLGAPFDGEFKVLSFTATRISYGIEGDVVDEIPLTGANGTISSEKSTFNGDFTISAVTANTISYNRLGNNVLTEPVSGGIVVGASILNGTYTVSSTPATNKFSYALPAYTLAEADIIPASEEVGLQPVAEVPSIHLGNRTVTNVSRNTFTFTQAGISNAVPLQNVSGLASVSSIFNGTGISITAKTDNTFSYTRSAPSNILETPANSLAFVEVPGIYNGTFTLTAVSPDLNTIEYAKSHVDMPGTSIQGYGKATVDPVAIVSTFGPFPGNSNIGIGFSTKDYSGKNLDPVTYRGFELVNVGEALSAYSDSIDGFEYRIDCSYDAENDVFKKTFILIPINFPNPPAVGEVSPLSRFGADELVFEYPGNIINLSIEESAENSATRFFAVGENDLGPDAGPPFSVASANGFLRGVESARKWPLLDDDEKVSNLDDEMILHSYANRYLSEARPPDAKLSLSVNGSLEPIVGSYAPGDWCSLIVDDEFVLERLKSDMEPRDTVIVRKIDVIKVSVPDGTTFPEKVELTLVPEWEVDKRG